MLICYQNGLSIYALTVILKAPISIFIFLQQLLSKWPLRLIVLPSYITGNSI